MYKKHGRITQYVAGIQNFSFYSFMWVPSIQCYFFSSPPGGLNFIDHIVGNQPDDQMVPVSDW